MLETFERSTASDADLVAFRIARQADLRRAILGRCLVHGFPVLAGAVAISYAAFLERFAPTGPFPTAMVMVAINAVLAVIGSAIGVSLLTGRVSVRVAGGFAYGVLGLFCYVATCVCLMLIFRVMVQ